jgi:hypothetical protein
LAKGWAFELERESGLEWEPQRAAEWGLWSVSNSVQYLGSHLEQRLGLEKAEK